MKVCCFPSLPDASKYANFLIDIINYNYNHNEFNVKILLLFFHFRLIIGQLVQFKMS